MRQRNNYILQLSRALGNYLEDYNLNSTRPMKLVLFLDAVKHVSRISRVIRQPMGNALLLGMGGSGIIYYISGFDIYYEI